MPPTIAFGGFYHFQAPSNVNDIIDVIEARECSQTGLIVRKRCQIYFQSLSGAPRDRLRHTTGGSLRCRGRLMPAPPPLEHLPRAEVLWRFAAVSEKSVRQAFLRPYGLVRSVCTFVSVAGRSTPEVPRMHLRHLKAFPLHAASTLWDAAGARLIARWKGV